MNQWVHAYDARIHSILAAPCASAKAAAVSAHHQLLSNCLAVRSGRGKHCHILRRLQDAAGLKAPPSPPVDPAPMPARPMTSAAPADPSHDYELAVQVNSQVQSGSSSRAANCLDSIPQAEVTSQFMQEMHNLHSHSAPSSHIAVKASLFNLTEEDLDAVIENLGVRKTPGLTG
jgi:hypothetical protein